MVCSNLVKAPNGEDSQLYPELVSLYGEEVAAGMSGLLTSHKFMSQFQDKELRESGEPSLRAFQERLLPSATQVNRVELAAYKDKLEDVRAKLETRLMGFRQKSGAGSGLRPKAATIAGLGQLVENLANHEEGVAFVELLTYADNDLRNIRDFLSLTFDPVAAAGSKNNQVAAVAEIQAQLETYKDVLAPDLATPGTPLHQMLVGGLSPEGKKVQGLISLHAAVKELLADKTLALVTELQKLHANREGLSDEQVRASIAAGTDVTLLTRWASGADASSDKLVAATAAIVHKQGLEAKDKIAAFTAEVLAEGQKFVEATGGKDFGYMLNLDKNGKADGSLLQKTGKEYELEYKRLKDKLRDRAYHTGASLSDKEKAENLALYADKKAYREFMQAEVVDKAGSYRDGDNHAYTQEFQQARAQMEDLVEKYEGAWAWQKKPGVDEVVYQQYLRHYYEDERPYWSMKTKKGVPTGEVIERRMRFPNYDATTVVADKWDDPRYVAMQKDNSVAGKGRLDFYNFFTQTYKDALLSKLPYEVRRTAVQSLPVVRAQVATAYNAPIAGFLGIAGQKLANPLQSLKDLAPTVAAVKSEGRAVREDGTLAQGIPLLHVGGFYNTDKVSALEKALGDLALDSPTYEKDKKKLEGRLLVERNRMRGAEVETDLVKSLLAFGEMAIFYEHRSALEPTVAVMQHALSNRTYYEHKNDGSLILDKDGAPIPRRSADAANVVAQLDDWLSQNFYDNGHLSATLTDEIMKKVQYYTSVTFQGLNFTSAVRNVLVGNVTSRIEAQAGRFYDKVAINKATKAVFGDLSNIVADRLADHVESGGYKLTPKKSKVDAVMVHFHLLQHGHSSQDLQKGSIVDKAFIGTEIGEYQIQATQSIAALMHKQLVGVDGTTSSVWDALSLSGGKLAWADNFKDALSKEEQHRLSLDILNLVKQTQGNYSAEDKVALQKYWFGSMVLQFKKWAFDTFKARFGRRYFDEGTGFEMEGRYRSLARLVQALKVFGGEGFNYKILSKEEQARLRQVAAELKYVLVSAVAYMLVGKLLPDDDDPDADTQRAAVNFLRKTLTGVGGEVTAYASPIALYNNLKNPVASLTLVRDFGVFLQNAGGVPFYTITGQPEKLNYQTGYLKGESKLWKSTKDLIPVLRMGRSIDQLYVTDSNFIR